MNFLLSGCQNPDILRIILLLKKILNIVTIILPIALIIFLIIDLTKMIISGDNKQQGKTLKTIINRVIFAILIFFVPTIVNVTMTLISNAGINAGENYKTCFENATKSQIEYFQARQDEEDKKLEEQLKQELANKHNNNGNNDNNGNTGNNSNTNNGYEGIEGTGDLYNDLANRYLEIATNEIGYVANNGKTKYAESFNSATSPWCSAFVFWIAKNTEVNGTNLYDDIFQKENKILNPLSATNSIYTFNKSKNLNFYYSKAYDGNYTPKKGDLIYYKWEKTGTWNKQIYSTLHISNGGHVEIVNYVSNNKVYTIGGNNSTPSGSRGVTEFNIDLNSKSIIGYGSWYK